MNYSNGIELIFGEIPSSIMTRGLLFGENIFTSFSSVEGIILFLDDHLNRLKNSVDFLYPNKFVFNDLIECFDKIKELRKKDSYFRVTCLVSADKEHIAWHLYQTEFRPENKEKKLIVEKRNWPSNIFKPNLKLGDYAETFYFKRESDFLKVTNEDQILEASTSNIFFVENNKLITPSLNNKILSGIVSTGIKKNFDVNERNIYLSDLKNFEACFCTNGVQLVCPVGFIDQVNFENSVSYSNKIRNELMLKYKERQTL